MYGSNSALAHVQKKLPLCDTTSGCTVLRSRLRQRIAPEDKELREVRTDKIRAEGHEGGDACPRDFNLDLGNLDVMFTGTLEDLYCHVEDFRANVVRHIQRAVRDDGEQRRETVSMSQGAQVYIGRCGWCSE